MRVKFTSLLLSLITILLQGVSAQTLTLKGRVSEGSSNPIVGAMVILSNTEKVTSTDANGNYIFKNLAPGKYILKTTSLGFESSEKEILLEKDIEENISLINTAVNLDEVTVSPGKSITQSELISGVDSKLRPVNTSQDLLRLVPGLFIAQHAGGGKAEQIFLRGFDCDHGTDFYISLDGMPVNMVSHAHGQGYADFHFVIPETVDRLKVYKGPYNARFGDFSTSGTGEFFTKNSIDHNEVKAEFGMFDTYRALGMFKLLDEKHLFSKEKENAYIAGEYVFTNSYFDNKQNFGRLNLFSKYSGFLDKKNYLAFSASTFAAQWNASGQIPERAVEEGIIDRYGSIDPSEGGQTNRTNVNGILTTTTGNGAVIKNQLYYVNYYFNLFSDFTFYLNDPVHGDQINQTDQRNIFGYNGTYEKDYHVGSKILHATAGLGSRNDFAKIALKHADKRAVLDTILAGKVYEENTNSFFDGTLDISKHLSVNAGMRFDYFRFQYNDLRYDTLSGITSILRASPKLNFYYAVNDRLQIFIKSGIGFHSNDARAVVINHVDNSLPRAVGYELGTEFKLSKRLFVNMALWGLDMQSELVYVGDEGTVETNNPTRRLGSDLGLRWQLTGNFFFDVDLNYSHGRLTGVPEGQNYIPLAPSLTSIGGITYKRERGLNGSLRYRYIDSRPANEDNTVTAKGYFLIDAIVNYRWSKFQAGISVENLMNVKWNQAQFDTESRLYNEPAPVSELHFTPGTPIFVKGTVSFLF